MKHEPSRAMCIRWNRGLALCVLAFVGSVATAQTPAQEPAPPAAERAPPATPPTTPAKEPTLDELLGLPGPVKDAAPTDEVVKTPTSDGKEPATTTPGREALDRKLADDAEGDEFKKAVTLMGDAAKRLQEAKDPGLETQRLQQDILKSLDKMISDAQKNQQQKKSKQKQQQQQQQSQSQGAQQKRQPQQQQSQASPSPEGGLPEIPRQDGPGRTRAGNSSTWGDLPARVRDALVEGINDRFSARYRQKTEEYYKRLAEDKKGEGAN